jgi:hypothetical protein
MTAEYIVGRLYRKSKYKEFHMATEISLSRTLSVLHGKPYNGDSRPTLESLGFVITGTENAFYKVRIPNGWTSETMASVLMNSDKTGKARVSQFQSFSPMLNID